MLGQKRARCGRISRGTAPGSPARRGAPASTCCTARRSARRCAMPACPSSRPCTTSRCCASRPGSPPGAARYGRHLMPRAIRLADRVVCVSHATARDASDLLGVPDARLRVVPNGIDASSPSPPGPPPLERPYILFVGTPEPRKNLERLARGVRGSCAERAPRAARARGRRRLGRRRARLDRGRRRARPGRRRRTLRDLYAHAGCVAYPSLWEGFGLVAGEALAAGCPRRLLGHPGAARGRGRRRRVLRSRLDPDRSPTALRRRSTRRGRRRAAR